MRASTLSLCLSLALAAATAQARTNPYPVISTKTYPTAQRAAACGGAGCITKRFAGRGILGEFGKVGSRGVKLAPPASGNRWTVSTTKLNPDNGQPLASTSVGIVANRAGKFHFLDTAAVKLNLPIVMTHKSLTSAAKAAGAKAFLADSNVKDWFASDGLKGADVIGKLRAQVISTSASGKSAKVRVYHKGVGQDGEPWMSTTVTVKQLGGGQYRGYNKGAVLNINDLWE